MQRALKVLVIVLTVMVVAAAGYVIAQHDPVPGAGTIPGGSGSLTGSVSTPPSSSSGSSSTSPVASTSSSPDGSTAVRTAFLGDNYTSAKGASTTDKGWASLVTSTLGLNAKRFAVPGGGYAKPGTDGRTYLSLVSSVAAYQPDLVIVSGGRNDTADDPTTLASNAKQLFADLRAKLPDATLVAVAPWWGDSSHPQELGMVADAARAGVTAAKGTYLAMPDPLAGHPSWMADAANPNDAGYRHIADAVVVALKAKDLVH